MRKFFHSYMPVSLFLVFLVMILCDCGGGGGGGDVTPPSPPLSGVEFTTDNLQDVASISAATGDFFNKLGLLIVEILQNSSASSGVGFPSGICLPGAILDEIMWNDLNSNTTLDAGDTFTVAWDNCFISGDEYLFGNPNPAITFTLTENVVTEPVLLLIQGTLALNFTAASLSGESTNIEGSMKTAGAQFTISPTDVTVNAIFGGNSQPEQTKESEFRFTFFEGGSLIGDYAFGCFDIVVGFSDADSNLQDYSLTLRGIAKIDDSIIMQMGDYEEPGVSIVPLYFINGIPDSGHLKLLSFDDRPNSSMYPGLSSCYGNVGGSTSSLIRPLGLGDGSIELELFNNPSWSGTPAATVPTTWDVLLIL